ncbi:hypothetical protein N7474_006692 [Penicillium riverlandense]|uniref:uncharacterized protein n=1 Tax=Penicillium riverlandense TaxID=1903569 RepID=UPI002549A8BA|nr:uncharacterized protein N7474_006692 [Penicillium riverlandense]KAJ5814915.1 hypothetical protein N7474_006692 [Penicillium riverlandense]
MPATATTFLDNPLLKVSRPVAACSRCRTAKIKCDGKLPACSACERVGKAGSCSGASDEFAKGKERSYVASLEGYCEKLEKRITRLRARQDSLTADGSSTIAREVSITSTAPVGPPGPAHRREASDIDDLVGDFGFLSVNATSRDFHGITSSTSFANLLLSVAVVEMPLPPPSSDSLPARHEAMPLLQHYFDNIFIQLPFFIETNFWTSVDAVYQSQGRFAKPFDQWMLRMVLAIASASVSYRNNDESHKRALALVSEALRYSEDVLRPGSISGIQSILLLAQYSLVDPGHFRSWYLVGMAVRVMVDLGLHQDPPAEVLSNSDRLDIRRRVFHCIYSLDRGMSAALGRTFSFSDASVNVELMSASTEGRSPADESPFFLRSPVPALHIVKIRQILSNGYQEMYCSGRDPSPQPLVMTWTLCSRVRDWYHQRPKNAPGHFSLLYRLELLYTMIILLSPSHRYPILCDYNKALLFDRSMDYISQIHQVLENPSILPFMTFLDIQRVYQVGQKFVEVLSENFDLLLSPVVPRPPSVPAGTPDPPMLGEEDRINCRPRAIRCLAYVRDLMKYSARKWDLSYLLEKFEQSSAPLEERLVQNSVGYLPGQRIYAQAPSSGLPPAGNGYSAYHLG